MTLSDRNGLARIGRPTFGIGSITFVIIGVAHTATQLTTLSSEATQTAYRAGGPIDVNGRQVDGWDLFAGISLLMGFYAIALGIIGLIALRTTTRPDRLPPAALSALYVVVLLGILVVGATLLGPLQLFGGLAGIVLFGIPTVAALQAD